MKLANFGNGKTFAFKGAVESVSEKVKRKQSEDISAHDNTAMILKYYQTHTDKISHIEELIGYPKKDEQYRIVTQNSFNAFTFVLKIINDFGFIKELFLSSYNISQKTLFALEELIISNKIGLLTLILSESIQFRIPQRFIEIENVFNRNKDKLKVAMIWNHTKIMLCKTETDYFVIEGSGNLSDNARIEQYIFENNIETYKFHAGWMNQLFEKQILKRHKIMKQ